MKLQGNIVDIQNKRIYKGEITFENGKIISIQEKENDVNHYILSGFVDAHIHIESSMLVPSEFARIAVKHGTVSTVSETPTHSGHSPSSGVACLYCHPPTYGF